MNTPEEAAAAEAARRESGKQSWDYAPGVFRERFVSPWEQYRDRVGQRFTVLRAITESDAGHDIDEVGTMYRIRFEDGTEIDAWPEEVCVEDPNPAQEGGTP